MRALEFSLIVALALWALAALGYCFGGRRWHVWARGNRQFRACSSWRLFSAADDETASGILELDYRDRSLSGDATTWVTVRDCCWSWHAFLWMPERRVTNRIFRLIRELAAELPRVAAAAHPIPPAARRLASHLGRRDPLGGEVREFRLVVRDRPGGAAAETLYSFCVGPDGQPR